MINFNSRKALILSTSAIACSSALVIISAYFSGDSAAVLAAASFPDIQNNYWAQPFIKSLADRNIVTGYPDNTFRPLKAVNRDEFAAILQKAFNQKAERQIASGSTFTDVPNGYWAEADIKSAYQMGFMKGYPNGEFRPKQPISKLEVIVALARNLKLPTTGTAVNNSQNATNTPIAAAPTATSVPVAAPVATPQPQSVPRQGNRTPMMPMALTTLMQPFMMTPARSVAATPTPPVAANDNPTPAPTQTTPNPVVVVPITKQPLAPSMVVNKYYQDAAKIPAEAIDDVAEATKAGIVVNYPNLRLLNPNQAATRGEISAMIYRALASQGKVPPITDPAAVKYVVK